MQMYVIYIYLCPPTRVVKHKQCYEDGDSN